MRFREQFLQRRRGLLWWRRTDLIPYRGDVQIQRGGFARVVRPDAAGWVDVDLEPLDVVSANGQVVWMNGALMDSEFTRTAHETAHDTPGTAA